MPLFQYKAVSPAGEVREGVLDADSHAGALSHLKSLGLIPIRAAEVAAATGPGATNAVAAPRRTWLAAGRSRSVSQADLTVATRELATLLKAGLPLDRSLEILISLAERERLRELLATVRNEVRGGSSLSKALDAHRDVFSRFYVNMVKAGEAGGSLGGVLMRLADHMERAKELRENVVSSLIYPIILLIIAILSVSILVVFVVPQFKQIFDQSGKALPWATDLVLTVGLFLRANWPVVVAIIVLAVWWLVRSFRLPASRARWDARLLRWRLSAALVSRVEMARFSRSLGTLLANGVPLLSALSILKETLGNAVFREAVESVARELKEGRGLAKPMIETGVFPPLAVQMIAVGEETGKLDEMLFQVAEVYDREVATAIKRTLAVLQPMLIICLTVVIALIIMSLLVAMFDLMDVPSF